MKHVIFVILFLPTIFFVSCNEEVWEKNRDATIDLIENIDFPAELKYKEFAKELVPDVIKFKDEDDGEFYFSGDIEGRSFKFYDNGRGYYKILVEGETLPKTIEVIWISDGVVKVRYPSNKIWIVYTRIR